MFVLNDYLLNEYGKRGLLHITRCKNRLIHGTYYYFRLGKHYQLWDPASKKFIPGVLGLPGAEIVVLPPYGYGRIASFERFQLSDKVQATFGQVSDLPMEGLRLNHSPLVDPNYEGHLHMAIENVLDREVELRYKMVIGKIQFLDISDTYPIRPPDATISKDKFARRKQLDDEDEEPWSEYVHDSIDDWE